MRMLRVNHLGFLFCASLLLFSCVTKQVDVKAPSAVDPIDAAMKVQTPAFAECFEHNRASGKIVLEFTLDHLGHMTDPKVYASTLKNPVADLCVLKTLNDVVFPPQKADGLKFKYPLSV